MAYDAEEDARVIPRHDPGAARDASSFRPTSAAAVHKIEKYIRRDVAGARARCSGQFGYVDRI